MDAHDPSPLDRLIEFLYSDLHRAARGQLAKSGSSLQPTELVNEAYLRLSKQRNLGVSNADFFEAAAAAMRRVVIDRARAVRAVKRGGRRSRVDLPEEAWVDDRGPDRVDLVDLDDAFVQLQRQDPIRAKIAELVLFGGRTQAEIAELMTQRGDDMTPAVVGRKWRVTQAWLAAELNRSG